MDQSSPIQRRSARKSKPKVYSDCVMFTSSALQEDNLVEGSAVSQQPKTGNVDLSRGPFKQESTTNTAKSVQESFDCSSSLNEAVDAQKVEITISNEDSQESGIVSNGHIAQEETNEAANEDGETLKNKLDIVAKMGDDSSNESVENNFEDESRKPKRRGRRPMKNANETFTFDTATKRYVCNTCNKTFRFRQDVQRHSAVHTGRKPYACNLCDKTFSRSDYLNAHLRIHKGVRDIVCDICGQSFYDKSNWRQHVDRCHGNTRPIACPFENCPMRFRTNSDLKKHIPTHTKEKPFQCDVCGRTFSLSASLQHHLRRHTGEKPYSCDFCDKTFRDVTACRRHRRLHTGEKPYVCQICDKAFIQKGNLTRHFLTHGIKMTSTSLPSEVAEQHDFLSGSSAPGAESVDGTVAGGGESGGPALEEEEEEIMYDEGDIVSQEEFVAVSLSSLRRSEQQKARWKHTYSCMHCNQDFTTAEEAHHHVKIEHPEPPQSEVTPQSKVARTEIVVIHNSDDPLSEPRLEEVTHVENRVFCEICLKDFRNMLSLKQHMITHTDEKPFICEICGAGFRKNNNLLRHHLVHTGEKPFSCDLCSKKFASLGNLKKHKVIHTGEKNYCCKLCGKAFSQSSNLKKHLATHDGEKKGRKAKDYSAEDEGEELSGGERGTLTIIGHEIILTEPEEENTGQELNETVAEDAIVADANSLECVLTIEGTDMVVEI